MTIDYSKMPLTETHLSVFPGSSTEHRAAVRRDEELRVAERQKRLASQESPFSTPEDRIRIWEQLHGLRLPLNAAHNLVRVVAAQTKMTVEEVHMEQARRAALSTQKISDQKGPAPGSSDLLSAAAAPV